MRATTLLVAMACRVSAAMTSACCHSAVRAPAFVRVRALRCCDEPPLPPALADWMAASQQQAIDSLALPPDDAAPEEVVRVCMAALRDNDVPFRDAGKLLNWELGGGMLRAIHQGDPRQFLRWTLRSPVYDCMVRCESFEVEADTVEVIAGTPTRGALAKVVVRVTPVEAVVEGPHSVRGRVGKPRDRRFLWTMQQQRRPPRLGAWLIYQCLAVDKAHELTN